MPLTHLLTLHTLSPLHCGTGHAVGAIELPIAREKPTHLPIVPGSSLKGVLRAQREVKDIHLAAFGPDTKDAGDQAGAVQLGDARLVLLPMRSVSGVFAWTTSPYLLRRLKKDMEATGRTAWKDDFPMAGRQECLVADDKTLVTSLDRVVLEDLDFTLNRAHLAKAEAVAKLLGEIFFPGDANSQAFLKAHLCIVHDDVMALLLEMGTELQAHVRLDPETKTVANGALWHEESLPVETLLASLVLVNGAAGKAMATSQEIQTHLKSLCHEQTLQFGGKASVGKGLCKVGLV